MLFNKGNKFRSFESKIRFKILIVELSFAIPLKVMVSPIVNSVPFFGLIKDISGGSISGGGGGGGGGAGSRVT